MRILRTLLFCGMCCVCAQAGNVTYITPSGSSVAGGPVDATAVFSISNGMIDVTLSNLLVNPKDVGQLLSDLSFTLGNGGSLSGASLSSSLGTEVTVNADGSFTPGSSVPSGWGFKTGGATTATLDVLGTSTAPSHLIIGPPGTMGYSNANGSIAGNKPHNPFLNGSATFVIIGPDITSSTTITSATFSFGTTEGAATVGGVPRAVPEPSAALFLGLGILGLIVLTTSSRKLIST